VLLFSMCFMHPVCLPSRSARRWLPHLPARRAGLKRTLMLARADDAPGRAAQSRLQPRRRDDPDLPPLRNPLTLESIFYGLAAAVMLAAVVLWFGCYNEVMTSDKFIYLFGRVIPRSRWC
jgi:energy-coupling factor transport system permease protein